MSTEKFGIVIGGMCNRLTYKSIIGLILSQWILVLPTLVSTLGLFP
jgi:hypothetical protein